MDFSARVYPSCGLLGVDRIFCKVIFLEGKRTRRNMAHTVRGDHSKYFSIESYIELCTKVEKSQFLDLD